MPLSERNRSTLYRGLIQVIHDEQAVEEMLSHFPSRDVDEPVTKDFLRAEMAEVRSEMERMIRSFQAWTIAAAATVSGLVVFFGTVAK